MIPLAHVRKEETGVWDKQALEDHLRAVADLAAGFAAPFHAEKWARIAGLLHDIGKAYPAWQMHLKNSSEYDPDRTLSLDGGRDKCPHHSETGAFEAVKSFARFAPTTRPAAWALAYAIAGHHAGLADYVGDIDASLKGRLGRLFEEMKKGEIKPPECYAGPGTKQIQIDTALLHCPSDVPAAFMGITNEKEYALESEFFHLWVRMLFSCLTDADFLDTEAFMRPERVAQRRGYASLNELSAAFDAYMESFAASAGDTPVNRVRRDVREDCLRAADGEPGFYSLTVPTGGGKTLSSFAFALKHALKWGKRRVIVAIPYTSIIEQTADSLRKALGANLAENVLEHHSNLDPEKETEQSRLAAENWDAPVVVTTNVQLFESLLGSSPSRCRKLHNIAGSVLILDEAQMLPLEHYRPALSTLRGLVRHFGVTVLLCTATQPALGRTFKKSDPVKSFAGLPEPREIVRNVPTLFSKLKRVTRQCKYDPKVPVSWEVLAADLAKEPRALAVVNTRGDCLKLYTELKKLCPEETLFHLSAGMCAQHRSEKIAEIKEILNGPGEVRVVSTQLIEAGVDIDFPAVYRAMCGLDSAVQAAGRCNREGRLSSGRLYLFSPETSAPPGLLRKGEDTLRLMLNREPELDIFDRDVIGRYFNKFYSVVNDFDAADFYTRMLKNAMDFEFAFRTFDSKFHLIDEEGVHNVFVPYDANAENLIEQLRANGPSRELLRRLQRYSVTVRKREFDKLRDCGVIIPVFDGAANRVVRRDSEAEEQFSRLSNKNLYDKTCGIKLYAYFSVE